MRDDRIVSCRADGSLKFSTRVAALTAGAAIPLVGWIMPTIIEILAHDLGLRPATLGAFSSADIMGMAVGTFSAIGIMRYTSPRATVVAGLALLLGADLASAVLSSAALVSLRAIGGFGSGLAAGACAYVYGLDPERNSGLAALSLNGMGIAAMATVPVVAHHFGWQAMFVCLAVPILPALILSQHLPNKYQSPTQASHRSCSASKAPRTLIWVGLSVNALSQLSANSFWAYVGRIGSSAGIAEQAIATSLSISAICGLFGSVFVIVLGKRLGGIMIAVAICMNVLAIVAASSSAAWAFASAVSAFDFSYLVYAPAIFGLLMRRAPIERFAVYLSGASMVGAIGPTIGGLLIERHGFAALQLLDSLLLIVAGALLWVYSLIADSAHLNRAQKKNGTPDVPRFDASFDSKSLSDRPQRGEERANSTS